MRPWRRARRARGRRGGRKRVCAGDESGDVGWLLAPDASRPRAAPDAEPPLRCEFVTCVRARPSARAFRLGRRPRARRRHALAVALAAENTLARPGAPPPPALVSVWHVAREGEDGTTASGSAEEATTTTERRVARGHGRVPPRQGGRRAPRLAPRRRRRRQRMRVALSSDGRTLAAGGPRGGARVWRLPPMAIPPRAAARAVAEPEAIWLRDQPINALGFAARGGEAEPLQHRRRAQLRRARRRAASSCLASAAAAAAAAAATTRASCSRSRCRAGSRSRCGPARPRDGYGTLAVQFDGTGSGSAGVRPGVALQRFGVCPTTGGVVAGYDRAVLRDLRKHGAP